MRARIVKIILPGLVALALCVAPAVYATGHGGAGVDEVAVKAVEAAHEANVAAEEMKHGETAAAMHEEKLAAEHGAEVTAGTHAIEEGMEAGGEHGAHGAGAHHKPMITPEKLKDLFWRTANFLALVVILVKFLAKPISNGLTSRRQQIKAELEELQAKRDEAERSYKEFEARLAGMEKEMETIVEKAIAQAEIEKEKILAEAEKAAEDIKRQAEAAVKAELVDAKRRLKDEVAEQAAAMAEELIVKNLTPADQVTITEQYLERVGAVQ
jgi:F-type H+-transporting ATPase subunit b